MRVTVRRICSTPSDAHAPGSVTTRAWSAANSPFTVSRPSDGGQSMMTRSWSMPCMATCRRSCAPTGSLASCGSALGQLRRAGRDLGRVGVGQGPRAGQQHVDEPARLIGLEGVVDGDLRAPTPRARCWRWPGGRDRSRAPADRRRWPPRPDPAQPWSCRPRPSGSPRRWTPWAPNLLQPPGSGGGRTDRARSGARVKPLASRSMSAMSDPEPSGRRPAPPGGRPRLRLRAALADRRRP